MSSIAVAYSTSTMSTVLTDKNTEWIYQNLVMFSTGSQLEAGKLQVEP
jgi:hypothetical protein